MQNVIKVIYLNTQIFTLKIQMDKKFEEPVLAVFGTIVVPRTTYPIHHKTQHTTQEKVPLS